MSFQNMDANRSGKSRREPDCTCWTCNRDIHHLGIMSHRAAHRRRGEDCKITFSDGRTVTYSYAKT